jgi:hypothetical protein
MDLKAGLAFFRSEQKHQNKLNAIDTFFEDGQNLFIVFF